MAGDVSPGAARLEFSGDLIALREDLVAMTVAAVVAIRAATTLLLQSR
jgi:hypothetical protein